MPNSVKESLGRWFSGSYTRNDIKTILDWFTEIYTDEG